MELQPNGTKLTLNQAREHIFDLYKKKIDEMVLWNLPQMERDVKTLESVLWALGYSSEQLDEFKTEFIKGTFERFRERQKERTQAERDHYERLSAKRIEELTSKKDDHE